MENRLDERNELTKLTFLDNSVKWQNRYEISKKLDDKVRERPHDHRWPYSKVDHYPIRGTAQVTGKYSFIREKVSWLFSFKPVIAREPPQSELSWPDLSVRWLISWPSAARLKIKLFQILKSWLNIMNLQSWNLGMIVELQRNQRQRSINNIRPFVCPYARSERSTEGALSAFLWDYDRQTNRTWGNNGKFNSQKWKKKLEKIVTYSMVKLFPEKAVNCADDWALSPGRTLHLVHHQASTTCYR